MTGSKDKADFLKECMSQFGPLPIDDFNRTWCVVCGNRECARSALNGMQFDQRAANWKNRLFTDVPRAQENDPRFDSFRSKKFLPMEPSVSLNMTPGLVNPVSPPKFATISPDPDEPTSPPIQIATPTDVKITASIEPSPGPTAPAADNTPFRQGTMLTPKSEDTVLQPGGSFTFDSDE